MNFPDLEGALPSLQEQLRLSKFEIVQEKQKEAKMELYVLANELDLNKEASLEAVHTAVKTLKADIVTKTGQITELTAKVKSAEDKAIELSKELKESKDAELKKEATESVRKWIELGKVHPAVQDIVINRYILNKEDVTKEMDLIPDKVYTGQKASNGDVTGLSQDVLSKMKKAGLDPANKEDVNVALSKWGGK